MQQKAPSSSGLGRRAFIPKIAGSTPAGVTINLLTLVEIYFVIMGVVLILGTQWGDEGKGKVIDALSKNSEFVVRFQGGNNAGHTVINPLGEFKLHLIPAGVFEKKSKVAIANGVVIDPEVLVEEIESLEKAGIDLKNRLYISPRCHIILPYHKLLEKVYEEAKGKGKTGTTGRGIGPVYSDKVGYNGIRLYDLMDPKKFKNKLEIQLGLKNAILKSYGIKPLSFSTIEKTMKPIRKKLLPYINEPFPFIQEALKKNKKIMIEGAQAVFLDNDWGTYPFVTASTIVSGGITGGAGIAPKYLKEIIGVIKAYTTRVGEGPFPTEFDASESEHIRNLGLEFGATTGRARRCGWLDLEMVRFAVELNGITDLALTKIDVLDTYKEIKLCTGYKLEGKILRYYDGDEIFLDNVEPVYKTMKGWQSSTKGVTLFDKLPREAKAYIAEIEKQTGVKVAYISTGPSREEMIARS